MNMSRIQKMQNKFSDKEISSAKKQLSAKKAKPLAATPKKEENKRDTANTSVMSSTSKSTTAKKALTKGATKPTSSASAAKPASSTAPKRSGSKAKVVAKPRGVSKSKK